MMNIRRIEEQDCQQDFTTGKETFDFDPTGRRLDVRFYFERDRSGDYESYVRIINHEIVGILCVRYQEDALYLSRVGVKEGLERKGYGKQLMKHAVTTAIEYGYRKTRLEAQEEVIEFFENIGYVVTRRYKEDWWGNSATMELFW